MRPLAQLLSLCLVSSVALATPFMPRFPDIEPSQPVVKQSSSGGASSATWIAGSTDKSAYIDRCQNVSIRVVPEHLPSLAADNIIFEFECHSGNNATISQVLSTNILETSGKNETMQAKICNSTMPAVRLMKLNATDYQLLSLNCSSERQTLMAPIDGIQKISIKLRVNSLGSMNTLQSKSLTIWYLHQFAEHSGILGTDERRLITKTAIDLIIKEAKASEFDESMSSIQFFERPALTMIRNLPLYLRLRLRIGVILTAAHCNAFNLSESVAIITNYFASRDAVAVKRAADLGINFSQSSDGHYIDVQTGTLCFSRINLLTKMTSLWSLGSVNLRLCEYLQFVGHGSQPYAGQVGNLQLPPRTIPALSPACNAVPGADGMTPLDALADSDGPVVLTCPLMCTVARNQTDCCSANIQANISGTLGQQSLLNFSALNPIDTYTCQADGGSSVIISVRTNTLTRFLPGNESLPARVFAMEGESLSYSCSAVVSPAFWLGQNISTAVGAISTVMHVPKLIGTKTRSRRVWKRHQPTVFYGSVIAESRTVRTSQSGAGGGRGGGDIIETVTVTVPNVPSANDSGNFTHRFACELTANPHEANRLYGMSDYTSAVGSDVVFIPRPTDESFLVESVNETAVQFNLHPLYVAYLTEVGAEVSAAFRLGDRWLNASQPPLTGPRLASEFQPATGSLVLNVGVAGADDAVAAGAAGTASAELVAVFNFRYPSTACLGSLKPRNRRSRLLGSVECVADPRCFYTTDFEGEATKAGDEDGGRLTRLLTVRLDGHSL